ncbi:CaiB/BaiF CoA transferase family protein [Blastococcus goldschmidtiae]|uniref:CoA transferase n=1 Tax=Blastococcus goldschmidtiae TaxID=3075546 RepID=A0ABU2K6W9_9ACTN|nr:CoA transferase [Blastococcus sp. DSM 46792]MDT0275929.1 CoA transferase [Blastococcus sp. DSM 46792]
MAGVKVVEFGQYIAVPGAAQLLADQGAHVIKVEPPSGEAARGVPGYGAAMFAANNRGKRMVSLDLRSEEGRRAAQALALASDVVMSNARPGAMARAGLSSDLLLARRPDLVCLTLTGFGEEGPMRTRPGLDIAAQAESGQMWITGEAEGEPQRVGFPVVDAAASYAAAQAVTAALFERSRSGSGADIRLSLWDVAIHLQASSWMDYALTGQPPIRKGNGQPGVAPAADVIEVADGYIVISAYVDAHWRTLCKLLDIEHLADDPRLVDAQVRVVHRPYMAEVLSQALRHLTREDCIELLGGGGIVVGAIRTYPEVRQLRGDGPGSPFLPTDAVAASAGAPPWHVGPPVTWGAMSPDRRPPRAQGADTDSVLAELAPSTQHDPNGGANGAPADRPER